MREDNGKRFIQFSNTITPEIRIGRKQPLYITVGKSARGDNGDNKPFLNTWCWGSWFPRIKLGLRCSSLRWLIFYIDYTKY